MRRAWSVPSGSALEQATGSVLGQQRAGQHLVCKRVDTLRAAGLDALRDEGGRCAAIR